ncbi:MAG: glycosyltransferase [Chloroflexi bacterium]|nr:MAG: glycosyltransferase [Chloroflexota bacterium]
MHIALFHFYSRKPNPVYQELANALRRRGHTVWVGTRTDTGDLHWYDGNQQFAVIPGPWHILPSALRRVPLLRALFLRLGYFLFIWQVRRFLRQHRPDIVQVNTNHFAWLLPLFMPPRMRFVYDIRQINEAVSKAWRVRLKERAQITSRQIYTRFVYPRTCFCHEAAARRILGEDWARRGVVVPVGVDLAFVRQPYVRVVADDERVRFVYVGTLSRLRNLERVIEAAALLRQKTADFCVHLVGPDTSDGYYRQVVDKMGVGDVVAILPAVPYEQIPALLAEYDVGLAYVPDRPTWHYQPTIKVLEYRALGLPILSTDVATHRDVVMAGVNGLLVADTAAALAEGMARFVLDRPFLHRCRQRAQQMRQGLSWDDVAAMYERLVYRPLLGVDGQLTRETI